MGGSIFVTLDKKKDSLIWEDFLQTKDWVRSKRIDELING